MFHEVWEYRKVSNSESDLQGHSRLLAIVPFDRQHYYDCRFPISVTLQQCLYYAPLLALVCQNLRRSRDTSHISFGLIYRAYASTPVYQSANIFWGQNLKTGHVTLTTLLLGASISPEPHARSLPNFVHVAYRRGSVLLRRGDKIPRERGNFEGFPH